MSPKVSRRKKILKAAHQLFHHYGHHKTTVSDIAKAAKISVGSVYLEFSSKDDIIQALSNEQHEFVICAMQTALQNQNEHPRERLRSMLHARTKAFLSLAEKGVHAPDLMKQTCEAVKHAHATFCMKEQDILSQFLTEAHENGELHCPSIEHTTVVLKHILFSFTPPALFHTCPHSIHDTIDTLCDILLKGIEPRETNTNSV